jgi:hypothetical protein
MITFIDSYPTCNSICVETLKEWLSATKIYDLYAARVEWFNRSHNRKFYWHFERKV